MECVSDTFEEVEVVEEDVFVYCRIPYLQAFRNVRWLPRGGRQAVNFMPVNDDHAGSFDAQGKPVLSIVADTLLGEKPIVRYGNIELEGKWQNDNNCVVRRATNLAVLRLATAPLVETSQSSNITPSSKKEHGKAQLASKQSVPSLLEHLPHGVDGDTILRKRRREAEEAERLWQVDSIVAPHATLHLTRVR